MISGLNPFFLFLSVLLLLFLFFLFFCLRKNKGNLPTRPFLILAQSDCTRNNLLRADVCKLLVPLSARQWGSNKALRYGRLFLEQNAVQGKISTSPN